MICRALVLNVVLRIGAHSPQRPKPLEANTGTRPRGLVKATFLADFSASPGSCRKADCETVRWALVSGKR